MRSVDRGPHPVAFGEPAARWVLGATILGSGMVLLDSTVVNVALPSIGADLDADVAGLQWTINGYLLPLAALILVGGWLGDRYGRRRIFVIGATWFAVASLLCALAPSTGFLVASRALQGVGGALLTPASLAIIHATFRREDRGRAIGAWSALGGIAAAVGPLLGGYLVDALSWRAVFLMNLPIAAAVVAVSLRHVPESSDPTVEGGIDLPGATSATLGLAGVTYALIESAERGLTSPSIVVATTGGLVALGGFVVIERRSAHPMLPVGIFSSSQFTFANLLTFVVYGALGGVFFLLVVQLQNGLRYSALEAGAASLPVTVLMLTLSPSAGALAQRVGPRLLLTVGPLTIGGSMLLMTRIEPGVSYVTGVLPAVTLFGLGLSSTVAPVTITVLAAADERHAGVASGVNNAVARVAGLLAVAVLPIAAGITGDDYTDPTALSDGFSTAMVITAALAAAGAVLAFSAIDDSVLERTDGEDEGDQIPARHCAIEGPPQRRASIRS